MDISLIQLFCIFFFNISLLPLLIPGCNDKKEKKSSKQSKSKSEEDIKGCKNTIISPPTPSVPVKQNSAPKHLIETKKEAVWAPLKKKSRQSTQIKPQKSSPKNILPFKDISKSIQSLTSTQSTSSKHSTNTFSFSNPVKLSTQEKNDQRKKLKIEKNLREWQGKNENQILITLNKSELRWEDGSGGLQNVNLENPSRDRIAVKIKCSDNILYRVNPVYTIIEPEERITIDILRDAGTQKTDKLVFVLSKVSNDVKDAQVYFSSCPRRQQMLVLPLIGASAVY